MHLNDDPLSLYDILELTADATPQEIRSAYLRLKSAYGKDNIAHYTVFSREETEQMLQNIENSYLVLSNPEKRKSYDQNQGLSSSQFSFSEPSDAAQSSHSLTAATFGGASEHQSSHLAHLTQPVQSQKSHAFHDADDIDSIINQEQNWSGAALKRIREAKRITLEDLSDYTRISRAYLHALEEEDFNRLPANVYVRGFLQQVSKRLKLPTEQVSTQYLLRLKNARPDK